MPRDRKQVFGYPVRKPNERETKWFSRNPHISGYAADDDAIVINPYAKLTARERTAVENNEGLRLFMRSLNLDPQITLTTNQLRVFKNTEYKNAARALRQTIVARVATGDPSAGNPTEFQKGYAVCLTQVAKALAKRSVFR